MTAATSDNRNRQIARSTIVVMIAFGMAKVISLVQTFIIADVFGVSADMDTYVTANRIPEQIFNLIAGGVLAHAFIPIFAGFLARKDDEGAWRTASHVINTAFVATLIVSFLAFLSAPWLIANVVAPGMETSNIQQTADLMRILLLSTLIFSVSGIIMGILQSYNHFLTPALAPIMYDIGILFGVVFLVRPMGITGLAVGAVIGAALHLAIQLPALFKVGLRWQATLGLRDPALWRVVRLMLPRIADLGVFSLNTILATNIASRLGTGAISALDWGWRLMQIPETLIGTAIGTVIFPTLAALSELGDEKGKRDAMSGALRFILIATIPSAVGLILIGQPLVSLLERGEFTSESTALVYSALRFFALGVVVHSILEVTARSFYADKDTLTPFWVALGGAGVNLVSALVFSGILTSEQPSSSNVGGLALANTLGVTFEVVVLLWLLRRRWHSINESELARTSAKTLAASLVMGIALVAVESIWRALGLSEQGTLMTIVQIGIQVGLGAVVFVGVALLLKMDEIRQLFHLVLRRRRPAEATA